MKARFSKTLRFHYKSPIYCCCFFVKLNMYVLPTIGYRVNRASLRIYNIMDPKSLVCYWNDNKDCFYNVDTNSYESTGTK
jgi:hypothetical protein